MPAGRRRGRWRGLRLLERLSQLPVIRGLLLRVEQANPCRRHLVQQPLRLLRVLARLERPQMGHPLVGGVLDHRGVVLERRYGQQPVVIGRLLAGRYSQPLVIRVEPVRHGCIKTTVGTRGAQAHRPDVPVAYFRPLSTGPVYAAPSRPAVGAKVGRRPAHTPHRRGLWRPRSRDTGGTGPEKYPSRRFTVCLLGTGPVLPQSVANHCGLGTGQYGVCGGARGHALAKDPFVFCSCECLWPGASRPMLFVPGHRHGEFSRHLIVSWRTRRKKGIARRGRGELPRFAGRR